MKDKIVQQNHIKNNNRKPMRDYTNLIDPVGVQNPEATQLSASTFLCNRPLASLELQLSNTLICGLTIHYTLGNRSLATTTSYTHTINHITLKSPKLVKFWIVAQRKKILHIGT